MLKIIGECGVNFNNIDEAKEMIKRSKEIGLWASKFQLYNDQNIKDTPKKLQKFLKSIQLNFDDALELYNYGKSINQNVFFSVMFLEAFNWISKIDCNYIKIRHRDHYNLEIIKECINSGKHTFLSMDFKDTWELSFLYRYNITPMFCIPKYPADIEDYLEVDNYHFHDYPDLSISDHTPDLELLEICLESDRYFEKHVCLTKDCLEAEWSCTFKELEEALK